MTIEQAIRILDPETTAKALAEIEYYAGFRGEAAVSKAVDDACILAVAALRAQDERKWIPVTERLPEKDDAVIICTDKNFIYAGELIGDTWYLDNDSWTETVTHWMPLPEPPKEGA